MAVLCALLLVTAAVESMLSLLRWEVAFARHCFALLAASREMPKRTLAPP